MEQRKGCRGCCVPRYTHCRAMVTLPLHCISGCSTRLKLLCWKGQKAVSGILKGGGLGLTKYQTPPSSFSHCAAAAATQAQLISSSDSTQSCPDPCRATQETLPEPLTHIFVVISWDGCAGQSAPPSNGSHWQMSSACRTATGAALGVAKARADGRRSAKIMGGSILVMAALSRLVVVGWRVERMNGIGECSG